MILTPFNENKFADVTDKLDFFETDGVPPEVREWADFQRQALIIERRKNLDDDDIFNSLVNLFRKIYVERLTDEEAMDYVNIANQYGVLIYESGNLIYTING